MIALLILVVLSVALVLVYADRNLHRDDRLMKKVWKAGFEEKQATLPNGVVINYGESGLDNKTPLMLIHGQGQAWQDYDLVLPTLAKKYHVFSVDCHGHGKSSHDPQRYTCKAMTEDYLWFIENIIKSPCVISGHSSGGIIASNIASTGPELISGLLIEDSPFFCVEPEEMKSQKAVVWYDSFQLMHDFSNQTEIATFSEYFLRNSLIMGLFGNLKDKVANSAKKFALKHPEQPLKIWYVPQSILRGQYYGHMFDLKFAETFYNGSWFDGVSQEEILSNIKCPCTYIKAKTGFLKDGKLVMNLTTEEADDAILCCANTDEDAEHVRSLVKNCKSVVTKSNDHLIHAKYPDVFVHEIESVFK